MADRPPVILPDLRHFSDSGGAPPGEQGWFVVQARDVVVPTLLELRRPLEELNREEIQCGLTAVRFDPPDRSVVTAPNSDGNIRIFVFVDPAFPETASEVERFSGTPDPVPAEPEPEESDSVADAPAVPVLQIEGPLNSPVPPTTVLLEGEVDETDRSCLIFDWPAAGLADGDYLLSVLEVGGPTSRLTLSLDPGETAIVLPESALTSITLTPRSRRVGRGISQEPATTPRPPLIAVDCAGNEIPAWSASGCGERLVPVLNEMGQIRHVQILDSCGLQIEQTPTSTSEIIDAIFWNGKIAVLTAPEVLLFEFDSQGMLVELGPIATGLDDPRALGVTAEGFLVIIQGGEESILVVRSDGSRIQAPTTLPGRGWYASLRSPAFTFDGDVCRYVLDPGRAAKTPCPMDGARELTDEESLFFRLIDDLAGLRRRLAYPTSGVAVLGPTRVAGDPLDAGRPGTQWHRIALFGEIPAGCTIQVRTRATDDLAGASPMVGDFSDPITLTAQSRTQLLPPGDPREVAGTAIVLAPPGRYLVIQLTLFSNTLATPRIDRLEVQAGRVGIGRYLPEFFQNSTPEDDFLRRWLALFEDTAFTGVRRRMQQYAELFDPRTAPVAMLPYLAEWLRIPVSTRLRNDIPTFRRVLNRANELAQTRGTIAGLRLLVELSLGIQIQIVESFRTRSNFILGAGVAAGAAMGPVLGCQTILSSECPPDLVETTQASMVSGTFSEIVALSTQGLMVIGLEAVVEAPPPTRAPNGALIEATSRLVNASTQLLVVGERADVPELVSRGRINLSSDAFVRGSVTSGDIVSRAEGVGIAGVVEEGATLDFREVLDGLELRDPFTASGDDRLIEADQFDAPSPGVYGNLEVQSGGVVSFAPGEYYLDSLTIRLGGTMQFAPLSGRTTLIVRGSVLFDGVQLSIDRGDLARGVVLVAYGNSVRMTSDFSGVIVAPSANVDLRDDTRSPKTYRGAFFGRSIVMHARGRLVHVPWDGVLPPGLRRFESAPVEEPATIPCETRLGTVAHHFTVWVSELQVCRTETLNALTAIIEAEKPAHTSYRIRKVGGAGWVLGTDSVVGQELGPSFDPKTCDPSTFGIVILRGPPRSKPLDEGFTLGGGAWLVESSQCALPKRPELTPLNGGSGGPSNGGLAGGGLALA